MNKIKIIFVCLGNYCRSPMAEAIFNDLVKADGLLDYFDVSSAGTKDWDVGLRPDYRTRAILKKHQYSLDPNKRAQIISEKMINKSDYLIAMSQRVADDLGNGENVHLLMSFVEDASAKDVPDPYPSNTFPEAFDLIETGIRSFYTQVKKEIYDH